ncbi:class E sortase [Streptomyces virens]|uniref:Class E sortase n=1 Tax=Streptomyces virens TaxID=285572 RepID=A0ABP6PDA1_9ACTN|nr:class E sortase [Streptomyces calvus]MBA8977278.1 sortase A [Streptomyces calvus]MYS28886.1 class E sortase [Streptomyces sp. SID7804]
MTALRPERESGVDAYGGAGDQGSSYGGQPYGDPGAYGDGWYDGTAPTADPYDGTASAPDPYAGASDSTAFLPPVDEETVALRIPEPPERTAREQPAPVPGGGRAARRKAARKRHGRRGGSHKAAGASGASGAAEGREGATEGAEEASRAPLSRVEARRQARARKASPAVVASRAIGEVFITTGVLMLLFVTYQLWWTNVRAHAQAGKEASDLQDDWKNGERKPGAFEPGQGFALLHIPKLDVVVPIAEGIDSKRVLDRGMVGHYAEGALKTAMPDEKKGNFGLAGHRNTHGEPFRYINRLEPGDPIVVETQDTYYVYKMASILPVTSPSNISVLDPVPKGSGFTGPGRYITLTTCTPEFTSKYRMIVWGKMDEERPRSKGKPDALVS